MGCCGSRVAEEEPQTTVPPPHSLETNYQASSTRAIAQSGAPPPVAGRTNSRQLRPQPSLSTNTSTPRGSTAALDAERNLSEQLDAPLRFHPPWTSKKRLWTKAQLSRERYEFFETRVTGSPEVWGAIRAATELMRSNDLPTAQSILTAAGVSIPTGDLVGGAFDSTGNLYKCPPEIVSDPVNIVHESGEKSESLSSAKEAATIGVDETPEDTDDAAALADQRREEKGKGTERDTFKVTCRLSDRGGPDVAVSLNKNQNVGVLARRVASQAGLSRDMAVRIAYFGKMLNTDETLHEQGWNEGHVINAFVVHVYSNPAARGGGD